MVYSILVFITLVVCFISIVYFILVYSTFVVFTLVYIQYGIQYISIPDIGSIFHIGSVLHIGAYSMCYDISAPVWYSVCTNMIYTCTNMMYHIICTKMIYICTNMIYHIRCTTMIHHNITAPIWCYHTFCSTKGHGSNYWQTVGLSTFNSLPGLSSVILW